MKVRVIALTEHDTSITMGKEYIVVGISGHYFRVVSDNNEPVVFPLCDFEILDPEIPSDWIRRYDEDEDEVVLYANPPGLDKPGFYEDYHDDKEYAIKRFQDYIDSIGLNIQARPYHMPRQES